MFKVFIMIKVINCFISLQNHISIYSHYKWFSRDLKPCLLEAIVWVTSEWRKRVSPSDVRVTQAHFPAWRQSDATVYIELAQPSSFTPGPCEAKHEGCEEGKGGGGMAT